MGITGLLPFVKNSCRAANIKDFSGASVAVDAYSWLHKGAFSCAEKLVKGEKTDGYVYYCIKQLNLLLEAGLKPIMIFDGCNLSSKEGTEKKRRENREKTRQRGKELLCEGKLKEARECFQRCVDVTPEMAREVIEACRKKSIDCIVAPYEADAQLAYLDKIGMVQLIITEDSDLILFGCKKIFFKMDSCGGGLLFEKENLPKSFGSKASKFSFEKFRYMCILSGCDYLPSLPGIGLAKACKFFTLTNNMDIENVLPKLPSYLKMPRLTVPNEYIDSFIKASNTFLYQLVFCPKKKSLVPLTPYPDDIKPEDVKYAGKYLPDDLACQLAMGDINVKTMEEFDSCSFSNSPTINEDKSVVWGSQPSSSNKSSTEIELTAFKFSTPNERKKKVIPSQKRPFAEMVSCGTEGSCTDEELFSMYGGKDAKKSCNESIFSEEDPLAEEEDADNSFPSEELPSDGNISQSSPHPKVLNIPFRKIVKSRFFASEIKSDAPNASLSDESRIKDESLLSINEDINDSEVKNINDSKVNVDDKMDSLNLSVELKVSSPKKDNKENIAHRFAKKKIDMKKSICSNVCSTDNSPKDKLKNDSWLNFIETESCSTTSTISSNGKSTKLLDAQCDIKNSVPLKNLPKRLITTKIQDFQFKKHPVSRIKLNSSLGSDGNSVNESLEENYETEEEKNTVESLVSPYFEILTDKNQNIESDIDITLSIDSEESITKSKLDTDNYAFNLSSTPKSNLNKSLSTKSKPGKCRTLGLSKNKKNCDKVSRKDTLLNFNFIREPKK
ncbi:exonuclease 1 [Caerostris darwini]|uniref:Exonuclease 1 n=1 Tax=Caerostris darwini TaxID=1538125 RepID=A0AAV4SXU4_9ARAC|nr:exonuclease 1 [Caerostris darwini]